MKRRIFIKNLSFTVAGSPLILNNTVYKALGNQLTDLRASYEDRVLVIIRMNGGNDGLNTVIPVSQYSNLGIQRNNILIPSNNVLPLTTDIGLHPSMTGMKSLFEAGKLSIIHNVGYPNQNRSHFRSMDIWSSGLIHSPATTGWLGRHFDSVFPNYPANYPNPTAPDPIALSMGYEVSETCQGSQANFSHAVNDPFENFNLSTSTVVDDGTYYGSNVKYIATIIEQANEYGAQLNIAANNGQTMSTKYNPNSDFSILLQHVARLISGGLKTKVYVLNINGFDTHDSQVDSASTITGRHADLLKTLSDGIEAFMDDIQLLGLEERVLGMTFSEFGRQIASNASYGTDHGDAGPMFLFGKCITNSEVGSVPIIPDTVVAQAGLPMKLDFRDIYGSVLHDWFGIAETDVQPLFESPLSFIPLANACAATSVNDNDTFDKNKQIVIYPNPCFERASLRLVSRGEDFRIEVVDIRGNVVFVVLDCYLNQGTHDIILNVSELEQGNYLVRIASHKFSTSKKLIKLK